jgi:hypothetical protein
MSINLQKDAEFYSKILSSNQDLSNLIDNGVKKCADYFLFDTFADYNKFLTQNRSNFDATQCGYIIASAYNSNSTRLLNETCLPKTIVSIWYSQKVFYNFSIPPITKQSANKINDFIQLIWNTTIVTGIGVSLSNDFKKCFVVTLYWPKGNILGKL